MIMLKESHAPFFAFFLTTAPPPATTAGMSLPDLPLRHSSVCVADKVCLEESGGGPNEDDYKNRPGRFQNNPSRVASNLIYVNIHLFMVAICAGLWRY